MEVSSIPYGVGTPVNIPVTQPVMRCLDCGEAWTDWRGEEARDAAVCLHQLQQAKPRGA